MEMTKTTENNCLILKISDKLSIYDVANLHHELLAAFEVSNQITIDLEETISCDSAAFQLLVAANKKAAKENTVFNIINPCNDIVAFINNIGFDWNNLCYQPGS